MKTNWIRFVATAALLGCATSAIASPPAFTIANYTRFNDLHATLTPIVTTELQAQLNARSLALYTDAGSFEKLRLCHATVGITEMPPQGRNVRFPGYSAFAVRIMDDASWDASKCERLAIEQATADLANTPTETLFRSAEFTRNDGGQRQPEKGDRTRVHINSIGGINERLDPLFAKLHERNMGELFDYRAVQTSIIVQVANFDDGKLVCLARVGLAGRSSNGRNVRIPGWGSRFVTINTDGSTLDCKMEAAQRALDGFLTLPYEKMLKDFSLAQEQGIATPELSKVVATAKRLEQRTAQPKRGPAITAKLAKKTTVTCTNQCRNGDCLRTFSDGRKERWTAPHVFDPLTNQWKWDITARACGV